MKLYSYQENAINAIISDPSHSKLVSMPTGTGKTITFLHAIKKLNKKCLIIVHREELLNQTYEKAKLCGYEENDISIISAIKKDNLKSLNIAMVQSLSRNLQQYDSNDIEMIVVDEAHHATADSYRKIFDHFKIFELQKILLGFTATPLRGDKKCLESIFFSHCFKMTLSEATQLGYICPVHGKRVEMDKSLDEIEQKQGDYDLQQLDLVMNCEEVNNVISEKCEHLSKVPAIVFCVSVDHAQKIAAKLREKKRKAISVSYKTPRKTLERIFSMLNQGRIEFITNAVKLSEGFDHPPIQSIIMARPTRSPVLYKQMIGRGLRNSPNKYDCFVLEFSGSDPAMMRWEDIDENCTFQSSTSEQKKSCEEGLRFYKGRLDSPNVKVLNIRVSPFHFYECYIRRICKFRKNFYYIPYDRGFCVLRITFDKNNRKMTGTFGQVKMYIAYWKEQYKSFYLWKDGVGLLHRDEPIDLNYVESQTMKFATVQKMGRWYPSEEEPMNRFQKKMLPNEKTSARKAEMMIEDMVIKKAINQYWYDSEPSFDVLSIQ